MSKTVFDDISTETSTVDERPKANQVLDGEPTHQEILEAVTNAPSEFVVTVGDKTYRLVELCYLDWMTYVSILAPLIEKVTKSLTPLLAVVVRSYSTLKYLGQDTREDIRKVAVSGDTDLLRETFSKLGVVDCSAEDLAELVNTAQENKSLDFAIKVATIFLKPLAPSAVEALNELSVASVCVALGDRLPELVLASLSSAELRNSGKKVDKKKLFDTVLMIDGFEMFDVVHKQYRLYVQRGKIRSFFEQVFKMTPKSINTGTPTA